MMSAARMTDTARLLAVVLALGGLAAPAQADPPEVGAVRELPVVSVSLAVGSTDKETKRAVYAPPPGWYVRSHRVVTANRTGSVAYSVGTVPAGWAWVSDERAAASGKLDGSAGLQLPHGLAAGGQVAGSQGAAVAGRQVTTASHHVLVVDVTAKGAGLWQGGGGVDLTVYAEMVYLGK
ncbi:MAG: hypothetical protein K2X87_16105 [Gemmataceae bacterium]|nr:hypothetical protein [Gemmataceae bacterium]